MDGAQRVQESRPASQSPRYCSESLIGVLNWDRGGRSPVVALETRFSPSMAAPLRHPCLRGSLKQQRGSGLKSYLLFSLFI